MDDAPFVVAHLSDLHVGDPDGPAERLVGPRARLAAAVARLAELPVDAVVVTGDLVDHGTVAEYEQLAELLAPLQVPVLTVGGNHDDLDHLRAVLGEAAPPGELAGTGCWTAPLGPLRVVAVDTVWPGFQDGRLDDARLRWAADALTATADHPTLVCLHHPPVATGMWWMDYGGVDRGDELEALVAANPQVVRVLAGHIHRATDVAWGGTVLGVAPALSFQSLPALATGAEPLVADDPPTIPLLRWDGQRMVAHHVPLAAPSTVLDLRRIIRPWPPYEAAARAGGPVPATGR